MPSFLTSGIRKATSEEVTNLTHYLGTLTTATAELARLCLLFVPNGTILFLMTDSRCDLSILAVSALSHVNPLVVLC